MATKLRLELTASQLSRLAPTAEQALALAGYAAEQGISTEDVGRLCSAARSLQPGEYLPCEVLGSYADLSKLVAPVTGSSLIDSLNVKTHARWVLNMALLFLVIAATNGILDAWFGDMPEPEEGLWLCVYQIQFYVLNYLSPFIWGALGSCVYLLKRYSDLAEDRIFDEDLLQGRGTRLILGAILGGVVQYLYDSSVFTDTGLALDANALGFLSGVGVKVVYGAIEKTIAALGDAMGLDSLRKAPKSANAVRKFLAEELAHEQDEDKRTAIGELLERANDPNRES